MFWMLEMVFTPVLAFVIVKKKCLLTYNVMIGAQSIRRDQWRIQEFFSTGQISSRTFLMTGQ